MSDATAAADEAATGPKNFLTCLSDGTMVKERVPRQRACNEPGKKDICAGHLKRWYGYGPEVTELYGAEPEIYRCERCQVLYRPNGDEIARTGTLSF